MIKSNLGIVDRFKSRFLTRQKNSGNIGLKGEWQCICRGIDGKIKWVEKWHNLVVNQGLNEALNATIGGQAQTATTWYLGLIDGATPNIQQTDTLATAAWSENTNISNASRPAWASNAPTSTQSLTNPTAATFNINADTQTIGGAFLAAASTLGETASLLYSAGTFSSSKDLDDGDSLEVTATFGASDDPG